jgi:hypothetical protein
MIPALLLGLPATAALWLRGWRELALAILPVASAVCMVAPIIAALWWPPLLAHTPALAAACALGLGAAGLCLRPRRERLSSLDGAGAVVLLWGLASLAAGVWLSARPVQGWDGLSIWLNHATVFARPAPLPVDILAQEQLAFSHWDYPPLLPGIYAWFLRIGLPLHRLPVVMGGLIAAVSGGVFLALRRSLPSGSAGLLAIAPCATSGLLANHFAGYADGLMVLLGCAGATLLVTGLRRDARSLSALGGVVLAGCALTKNEGMLLAAGCMVLLLPSRRHWLAAAPVLLAVLSWRLGLARHDTLPGVLSGMRWSPTQQLDVLGRMAAHLLSGDLWLVIAILALSRRHLLAALPVGLYAAGVCVVLAGSPAGLDWLTLSERARLLMGVVPLTLCTAGAAALCDYGQARGSA